MIEQLPDLVNGHAGIVRLGRWISADVLIGIGTARWLVAIRAGRIEAVDRPDLAVTACDYALLGTEEAWAEYWSPRPRPRHHDLSALVREGVLRLEGNTDLMMAHFLYLKRALELPRRLSGGAS